MLLFPFINCISLLHIALLNETGSSYNFKVEMFQIVFLLYYCQSP